MRAKAIARKAIAELRQYHGTCLRLDFRSRPYIDTPPDLSAALSAATEVGSINSVVLNVSGVTGSKVEVANERARTHFSGLASFIRTLGESSLPSVAILDGCVAGSALGIGVHASACVATERTRLTLPGPAFGFVPESFASYQLMRLPKPGLGAYLALTGAGLSGAEMKEVGLATHLCESQAVGRVEQELLQQRTSHVGGTLRNVELGCVEPCRADYTEAHALFYSDAIAECFGNVSSVGEIIQRLRRGDGLWHQEALAVLQSSSPLALCLTFEALALAAPANQGDLADATDLCWRRCLEVEAALCERVLTESNDAKGGLAALVSAKAGLWDANCQLLDRGVAKMHPDGLGRRDGSDVAREFEEDVVWEHASVDEVDREVLRQYLAVPSP